jgi:hypothetical protein
MLPNLARLDLGRHEAATSADDGGPSAPPQEASPLDFTTKRPKREPPPPPAHIVLPVIDEEDDPANDLGLSAALRKREEDDAVKALMEKIDQQYPLGTVHELLQADSATLFQDALTHDEPPNRYLFSSTGPPANVRFMRVSKDTWLEVQDPMNKSVMRLKPFPLLKELRKHFANKPASYRMGCGESNCYWPELRPGSMSDGGIAIWAIMLSLDKEKWKDGLPATVAIRAPKAANFGANMYSAWLSRFNRDELELTLHAARMGISPPVYGAFPIKVLNENHQTLGERSYGYIYEDGWSDLVDQLYILMPQVHQNPNELQTARASLAQNVYEMLRKVANEETRYLLFDIKYGNMVARRVGETAEYEVRMVDFSSALTAVANKYGEQTSPDCVFFINGILFLNAMVKVYDDDIPLFRNLAMEVVKAWRTMTREGGLCKLLDEDEVRLKKLAELQDMSRVPAVDYVSALRMCFYRVLQTYGKDGPLLGKTDRKTKKTPGFIERVVNYIETTFA